MGIVRFCPASVEKVTRSPHSKATFQAWRWLCQIKFLKMRSLKTFILAIIGGYLLKLNVPIEGKPGFLTIYCKSTTKLLPLPGGGDFIERKGLIWRAALLNLAKLITGSRKGGRNRLKIRFPTSCFGSGQWLSNMEHWMVLYVLYKSFSKTSGFQHVNKPYRISLYELL